MQKKPLTVGNWKMELSHKGEKELALALRRRLKEVPLNGTEVVVCPSFPSLAAVGEIFRSAGKVMLGAQNAHWEERGAYTGFVSILQAAPYVRWCIVGHSEQRRFTNINEEQVQVTANNLIRHGVNPIVCVGETRQERESDKTVSKVVGQIKTLLGGMTRAGLSRLTIAYEPIWAIGTGVTPDPNDAAGVMLLIRKIVAGRFGQEAAGRLRVLYGGSVKVDNVEDYVKEPGVDGVLVGGASVQPRQFVDIVKIVQNNSS